jgi:hypothetical protein
VATGWSHSSYSQSTYGGPASDVSYVISRNGDMPWPAKSPDLSACDFFLRGCLKGKVYTCRPNNVTVLKQPNEEIQNIPDDMLRKVMADVRDRVEQCLRKGGSYLKTRVQKTNSKSVFAKCFCLYNYAC